MEAEGIRLNRYISETGLCSRREADRLIAAGKVEIRRKTRKHEPEADAVRASLGDRVFHGDTVYVNGRELPKKRPDTVCYIYHKPRGVICTADRQVPENIMDAAGLPAHVRYAGRLDKDSSGLMLMTSDGDLIDRVMRASGGHEKEYICTIDRPVTKEFLAAMEAGVKIRLDDEATLRKHPEGLYVTTRPCRVRQTGERRFSVVLTQGYNRQIRRMCRALGCGVTSLKRTRLVNLLLGDLKEGESRKLTAAEVEQFRKAVFGGNDRPARGR